MIAHLSGTVIAKNSRFIIVEAGGVGYKAFVTNDTLDYLTKHGQGQASLWTYLAVREDALDLYGFVTEDEMHFFELLIGISGIGPKSAMTILSAAGLSTLTTAVASGNSSHLTKISGISKKNAEKIVLELHGKLSTPSEGETQDLQTESDAVEALKSLGYSQKESRDALKKVPKEITSTSEIVKHALKDLGKA